MNNVKTVFSIKDLENLSGVKAHTIRIWEKRYQILEPMRTDTNIRLYDLHSLQKLLNICFLHDYGYKISKIAKYSEEEVPTLVRQIISTKNAKNHAINAMKMAMMHFDQQLFFNTYDWLAEEKSFREIFQEVFIPLFEEIGLLWQTDTISPAHEHFMSYLIRQKIILNSEKLQVLSPTKTDKVFVLSLPVDEIHELGLMYLHYEILLAGYKSIYLGESMPVNFLSEMKKHFNSIVFVSCLTVKPDRDHVNQYVKEMVAELSGVSNELWFTGRLVSLIDQSFFADQILVFNTPQELIEKL